MSTDTYTMRFIKREAFGCQHCCRASHKSCSARWFHQCLWKWKSDFQLWCDISTTIFATSSIRNALNNATCVGQRMKFSPPTNNNETLEYEFEKMHYHHQQRFDKNEFSCAVPKRTSFRWPLLRFKRFFEHSWNDSKVYIYRSFPFAHCNHQYGSCRPTWSSPNKCSWSKERHFSETFC